MLLAALFLLVAEPAVALEPPVAEPSLSGAAHAIESGRLDQAKAMISAAIGAGVKGDPVDRLLADLALARGDYRQALASYRALLVRHPRESILLERAGIAALRLGEPETAVLYLDRATAEPGASWRAWNARGVAADQEGRWGEADAAYRRAQAIAPGTATIANNRGWSLMLRGRWAEAASQFEKAAAIDPKLPRLANNLQLAHAALDHALPGRRAGENDESYAARLNDAGVVAEASGDTDRARAAFAQAIALKTRWNALAARNLASLETVR